ncbi:MAG: cation:proton antiporter [Endozoicomonadaceae bacterium]|nr:cation:proton antiporter [Endozoicomonadaceae bacterium]
MESYTGLSFFYQLLIIFSLSVVVISLCHRLKIPESLAYLFVGFVLSPGVLNTVSNAHQIDLLAEIGVVFLLFSLGLEFSVTKLMSMRRLVFGLGGLQVLISMAVITFIGLFFDLPVTTTLIMAAGLSLSSTAIVSKELTRRNEIRTPYGEAAISTLIFQDVAAVVFLIIVSALAVGDNNKLGMALLLTFLKGSAFVLLMMVVGKKVLPYVFHEVAATRSEELFVLTAIVIALSASILSHVLGLSMVLGGFVSGMMLGESHYKHQVETDIRPFRDILLGLFFVSVGLMLDLKQLVNEWWIILLGAAALITLKTLLISVLGHMIGLDRKSSLKAGLALSQGGEFCFALIALANQHNLFPHRISTLTLSIAIVSMICTPFLIRYSDRIVRIVKGNRRKHNVGKNDLSSMESATSLLEDHILICGYGRVGQVVSRFIRDDNLPYIALDDDPLHVKEAIMAAEPVFYGDCRRKDILTATGVARAKMAVICLDNAVTANKTLKILKELNPELPVLVRTRDDSMMEELYQNGATRLIPEVLESSLLIVSHVLTMLGKPEWEIKQRIQSVRQKKYRRLHGFFIGQAESLFTSEGLPANLRHGFTLNVDSCAVGKSLYELPLEKIGVEIDKIIRNKEQLEPEDNLSLQPGDLILLTGSVKAIAEAEDFLSRER